MRAWIPFYVLLTALAVAPGKEIWTDESVQFAIGAYESFSEAVSAAVRSIRYGMNHNQTGVYVMADWALLRAFGASAFWMRFPSLLSFFWILLAGHFVFTRWGLPARWRIFGAVALFATEWVRLLAYEARPYLPFAAGFAGAWVFLTAGEAERARRGFRAFGILSLLLASIIHPYFGPCFGVLLAYSGFVHRGWKPVEWKWCVLAGALYFTVGFATWMTPGIPVSLSPFEWIGTGFAAVKIFFAAHLHALGRVKIPFLAAILAFGLAVPAFRRHEAFHWFLLALFISAALSLASYLHSYWILQRQWVASLAIAAIALPAMAWEIEKRLPGRAFRLAFFLLLAAGLSLPARDAIGAFSESLRASRAKRDDAVRPPLEGLPALLWEMNRNVAEGGPVSPRFRVYFGEP